MNLRAVDDADPAIAAPLAEARSTLGMVPNLYAAMANFPALLDSYRFGDARFRAQSDLAPSEQELVLLVISRTHDCRYCVAAHSMAAEAAGLAPAAVDALREDLPLADARLEALRDFTREMVVTRGFPRADATAAFLAAGYVERQILAIVLAIAIKVMSNYTNHLFATPLDPMFERHRWEGAFV